MCLAKQYFACIPREHRSFWQVSRLDDFTIDAIANLFLRERLKIPEANIQNPVEHL